MDSIERVSGIIARLSALGASRRADGYPDPDVTPEAFPKGWRGYGVARPTSHRRANGCAFLEWWDVEAGRWVNYPRPYTNDHEQADDLIAEVDPTGTARVAGVYRPPDPSEAAPDKQEPPRQF